MEENLYRGRPVRKERVAHRQTERFPDRGHPGRHILMMHNYDKPGVIGNIGETLGKRNINIATMQLGRNRLGGNAIALLHVDTPLSPEVLEEVLRLPNIISVRQIEL